MTFAICSSDPHKEAANHLPPASPQQQQQQQQQQQGSNEARKKSCPADPSTSAAINQHNRILVLHGPHHRLHKPCVFCWPRERPPIVVQNPPLIQSIEIPHHVAPPSQMVAGTCIEPAHGVGLILPPEPGIFWAAIAVSDHWRHGLTHLLLLIQA